MKNSFLFIAFLLIAVFVQAQTPDFSKSLADARSSYKSGNLENARFAMQQMLQDIDLITGKEILKMLPQKMKDSAANMGKDNVSVASGYYGVMIHREYGKEGMNMDNAKPLTTLEVITNSPMIASINGLLSLPMIGMTGDNKVIKISGYKALVTKVDNGSGGSDFEVQLPLNNTLITFKAPGNTYDQVVAMANTIPVSDIAKMVQ